MQGFALFWLFFVVMCFWFFRIELISSIEMKRIDQVYSYNIAKIGQYYRDYSYEEREKCESQIWSIKFEDGAPSILNLKNTFNVLKWTSKQFYPEPVGSFAKSRPTIRTVQY